MHGVDYDFACLDLADESAEGLARRAGWLAAVRRGFHGGRHEEEYERRWLDHARADGVVCRGAWLPEGEFGAGPVPVATLAGFDKTINAGTELLPLRMVTDVTTSPAHRRRGLLRRLMEDDLADAADRGVPLAALTASEATIYGRWGFGVATFSERVELDAGPRFGLRGFSDDGRVEMIEPPDSWPLLRDLFDRFHARTRGSVEWPQFYEPLLTGAYDFDEGADKKLRGAVHLAPDGTLDGFALYRFQGKEEDRRTVRVVEMLSLAPRAQLALWRFLGELDLVERVTFAAMHPRDPLRWALTDINSLRVTGLEEFLWIRVLDVATVFEARPWGGAGRVVLEVDDPQGYAAGRHLVDTGGDRPRVVPTDEPAHLRLDAETLGSLSLGAARVGDLHAAGRLHGEVDDVARFAAMADLAEAPYNLTGF